MYFSQITTLIELCMNQLFYTTNCFKRTVNKSCISQLTALTELCMHLVLFMIN